MTAAADEFFRERAELLKQQAREAEGARVLAILHSQFAECRKHLAVHLIVSTDLSPDDAVNVMRAAPIDPPHFPIRRH